MQDFFDITIKTVNDLALLPNIFGKLFGNKIKRTQTVNSKDYGGFTESDWLKVGNDMKRGLLCFSKRN